MASTRESSQRNSTRRRAARLVAAGAAALAFLGACGQRGPLYLPDSRPPRKLAPLAPTDSSRSDAPQAASATR